MKLWPKQCWYGHEVVSKQQVGRRAEYAANTRQAIVDAARRLFAERGYFATRVDDIAELARVAPATVYAVSGGKQGLLNTLTTIWSTAPIVDENRIAILATADPAEIVGIAGHVTRRMREDFGDIMRVALSTAPHDAGAAESLEAATRRYRSDLGEVATRLADLGALRAGLTESAAADLLWFYFGFGSMFTLTDDLGWSYERAERWLTQAAIRDLL
uniref:TetR/AcrR family transcriptional regulator n=1 Tax=Paractinoplanes polyasparticus TaxID=2856853 RepID=UPI001C850827|nr:TetR/AcrR family transcriptional regulator [Actinoplanes polyasparticus]